MRLFIVLMTALCIFGCEEDRTYVPDACTSSAPIEEVEWMQELKSSLTNCFCETSIVKAKYLSETVFYVAITDPQCCTAPAPTTIYDCNGMIVRTFDVIGKDQDDFKKVRVDSVLYRCNDYDQFSN